MLFVRGALAGAESVASGAIWPSGDGAGISFLSSKFSSVEA